MQVDTDSAGSRANSSSGSPSISADGRYVTFSSEAWNLVPGDELYSSKVFEKDLMTGVTTLVSSDSSGNPIGGTLPSISSNGRYVAFVGNLGTSGSIYLKDTLTGITTEVVNDPNGNTLWFPALRPSVSSDGRYIAFLKASGNFGYDTYVVDSQTGAQRRIANTLYGVVTSGAGPTISDNGRFVSFFMQNGYSPYESWTCFVYDITTQTMKQIAPAINASISADGSYVTFDSSSSDLVAQDTNGVRDVFTEATGFSLTAGKPNLVLGKKKIYWRSYSDYRFRLLSVDFQVTNSSIYPAYFVSINGSTATNGVTSTSLLPVPLGNMASGYTLPFTIRYTVPAGTVSFSASVTASCQDGPGNSYVYP